MLAPAPPPTTARDRILAAALELFYRDGLRATGVDALIAAAQVTKVTFYRHFPSKDALVQAFLERRHEIWSAAFAVAMARARAGQSERERERAPLAPAAEALASWFAEPSFRGCAFINAVAEIGGASPQTLDIAERHKQEMTEALRALVADRPEADAIAGAARLALDGAIVRAQHGPQAAEAALRDLRFALAALAANSR